ncbi:MAG: hypothetical protein SGJ19_22190 [Planctomycetia bacterium]|nr:hypothetical protein [Planctomycetia bacterium]
MRISIDKPQGFLAAASFRGFEQPSTGSAIAVTELTAPREAILATMTAESLSERGLELLEEERVSMADGPARLLIARQFAREVWTYKWISISGNETTSVLVTASCPERNAESMAATLRQAVLSVRCYPNDEASDMPESAVKELVYAGCAGDSAIYTEDGRLPLASPVAACMTLSFAPPAPVATLQEAAGRLLASNVRLREIQPRFSRAVQVGELSGWEIRALAQHAHHAVPLLAYICVVATKEQLVVMQGSVGDERRIQFEHVFARFARGYRERHPIATH